MRGHACSSCGCTAHQCGCCAGVQTLTPASRYNRPGLPELSYRVGTHAQFLQTMQARLSTMTVDGVALDGQSVTTFQPLQGLTTRAPDDFSLALLDSWAALGDVLSFYQERIANEGFLRTATERHSVLELSRLVGYSLRPGVAATVYLAYTLDANQGEPVLIPTGARSQSIPGPDEQAQFFETSEDLVARREWNNLQVRLQRPAGITLATSLSIQALQVAGTVNNLRKGDKLLMVFEDDVTVRYALRAVSSADTQQQEQRTVVNLVSIDAVAAACVGPLANCIASWPILTDPDQAPVRQAIESARAEAEKILNDTLLGGVSAPKEWAKQIEKEADYDEESPNHALLFDPLKVLQAGIDAVIQAQGESQQRTTSPDEFVTALLQPTVPQVANSSQLSRSLAETFKAGADTAPQLLVSLAPQLRGTYYKAWAGANLNAARAVLRGVFVLRVSAALFGATAAKLPTYYTDPPPASPGVQPGPVILKAQAQAAAQPPAGTLKPQDEWNEWRYDLDEEANNAFLDQAYEGIATSSYIVANQAHNDGTIERHVLQVLAVDVMPRTAYGLSGKATKLKLDRDWREVRGDTSPERYHIDYLRKTQVYAQSEALKILDEPIVAPVSGQEVQLSGLYNELVSGRWVVVSGERADVDAVSGVKVSELQMISGLEHGFDPNLAGDQIHTTLQLATPLAYQYKRDTLTIYGNVVKATHGATVKEVLGSGDGAQSLQSFVLKQPPITFVAAPTPAGAQSTLQVHVDDVEWYEAESLAFLGPKDRGFITATDDAAVTTLRFGNGEHGARLPSGVENVRAVYRSGIGAGGNVKAQQISLLQTRPQGVQAVLNPLRASGGADKESRDLARENAPLSVLPLDRLVGIQDYADFTRRFAGIAKARATRASDGRRYLVQLTIAGADDVPIDPASDLYRNLLEALYRLGDPDLPLRVELRELKILVLGARLKILPSYRYESVASAVRSRLLTSFGFNSRALGQSVCTSELISAIQGVPGVAYVDIDAFGAIPEKVEGQGGVRRLPQQSEIASFVQQIIDGESSSQTYGGQPRASGLPDGVSAWPGGAEHGVLRPAELAIFTAAVPDTLILNRIP